METVKGRFCFYTIYSTIYERLYDSREIWFWFNYAAAIPEATVYSQFRMKRQKTLISSNF